VYRRDETDFNADGIAAIGLPICQTSLVRQFSQLFNSRYSIGIRRGGAQSISTLPDLAPDLVFGYSRYLGHHLLSRHRSDDLFIKNDRLKSLYRFDR
jgi:hypothetical protein